MHLSFEKFYRPYHSRTPVNKEEEKEEEKGHMELFHLFNQSVKYT